ncbi:MAG: pitrilysin family protein [Myxococcota bacterium]
MAKAPVHFERLANGLELLVQESHASPVAEVEVWARVGSADERAEEAGLAHFHEHMLFKGTSRRGVGEVAGEVEGVGGHINAYTSFDTTVYHATVPSESTGVALDVLADAVRDPLFDPEEIEREVEVVLEEIRRSEDSPHSVLGNAVFAEVYRRHPYRAPILGTMESVAGFDRDRVRAFFERWYQPGQLFVVIAGDVETAEVVEAVRAAFPDAPGRGPERSRPAEPESRDFRPLVLSRPFERASLDLCLRSVPLSHADAPALDLLGFILGEGDSSRLVRRVKEQEERVDRIDAYSYTPLDPGLFGITADLDPERTAEAVESCVRELERLREERVSEQELEKARANFLASEYFERESVTGLARKIGCFHALSRDHADEARYLEAIRTASADDLLRVARAHLDTAGLTVGVLLPEGTPAVNAEDLERAAARGCESIRRAFAPPERTGGVAAIHSYELRGGARLVVQPREETPVVAVRAVFLGGLLAEDERSAGLTSFLTSMWLRGTSAHSSAGFARSVESLASEIEGFSGRNSLGLALDCLADRLDPALDLFAEVLLEPTLAPEEVEKERRDTLAALERREDRLGARTFDLFQEELYGAHPYRFPVIGTEESVERFSAESVAAHHKRLVHAPNLVLSVVGDVDPDRVAASLSVRLADLSSGPFSPPAAGRFRRPDGRRERELRKERAQAHLVIGFAGLTVDDPDREALEVIAQILAGQSGRLFLELRDRQGLAYAVSASNVEGVAPGFFATYIGTAPEKLDAARAGMESELARLLESPPAEPELEAARRHLAGSFAIEQQRCSGRATHLALDVLYGLGVDAHRHYPDRVLAVSKEDVLRVARRVIDLDACVIAAIRP